MRKQLEMEIKVGLFVTLGVILTMAAILILGSTENLLSRQNHYYVHFNSVEGLIPGAKIVLAGVNAGTVSMIDLDPETRSVKVVLAIAEKFIPWVRTDSYAEIATQGVLGDKMIVLHTGSPDAQPLPDHSEIQPRAAQDLTQFLNKSDQLISNLTQISGGLERLLKSFESGNRADQLFQGLASTARNLSVASEKLSEAVNNTHMKDSIHHMNSILEKIDNGTGSVGAFINDPSLYDELKALVGGANRNRIIRNLVRQTIKNSEESSHSSAKPEDK